MMQSHIIYLLLNPSPANVVIAVWTTVLVLTSGITLWNRETKRKLREQIIQQQSAVDIAQTTVALYKEQIEAANISMGKLEFDKALQNKRITTLEAKTDLDSLRVEIVGQYAAIVAEMKKESSEIQLRITQIIQGTVKEIMLGFAEHSKKDELVQQEILGVLYKFEETHKSNSARR